MRTAKRPRLSGLTFCTLTFSRRWQERKRSTAIAGCLRARGGFTTPRSTRLAPERVSVVATIRRASRSFCEAVEPTRAW